METITSHSTPAARYEYIKGYAEEKNQREQVLHEEAYAEENRQKREFLKELERPVYSLKVQGRLLEVDVSGPSGLVKKNGRGGGTRREITQFSAESRRRLLKDINRCDRKKIDHPVFITLTYGQEWPDIKRAKNHIKRFNQELHRRCKNACGWWRMEPQERGAPHFHIVVLGLPRRDKGGFDKYDIAHLWGRIIGKAFWDRKNNREPFTRIESLDSWKKVTNYVCKYVAKVTKPDESDCGFNTIAYRHTTGEVVEQIGRQWGRFNSKIIPYAVVEWVSTRSTVEYYRMRRLLAHMYKPLKRRNYSFHTYMENPQGFLRYLEREFIGIKS